MGGGTRSAPPSQQKAELKLTRAKAEATAALERRVAQERHEAEVLFASLQCTLDEIKTLLESKEEYISLLLDERGSDRQLGKCLLHLTMQSAAETVKKLLPKRRKPRKYQLCDKDGDDDTRRTLYNGTFLSW